MGAQSVRFDRVSDLYDSTRALSAMAMATVLAQVVPEVKPLGRCLELGIGTGRFALPLADIGVDMAGVDLSPPMLAKLVEKAGGAPPFPLAQADATRLPFRDAAFGSALSVHVLHLIPNWETALDEVLRTTVPGGKFLVDLGGFGSGTWWEFLQIFADGAGLPLTFVGAATVEEVDAAMERRGVTTRKLEPVHDKQSLPYRQMVRLFEEGAFSFTWGAEPDELKKGGAALRRALDERDLELDGILEHEREIVWHLYELPR